ncbi:MAG: hypothetical protein AB7V10_05620 [Leucobacter sp.]|jgi:archaellum component FlaC
MTEPQIWTVIGVLAAALASTLTFSAQATLRAINSLRTEMVLRFQRVDENFGARFERVEERIDRVDASIERLDTRVGNLEKRVDDIDRDVQAIARHIFPDR